MGSYTAIQGTPIIVSLIAAAQDTGWSVSNPTASHSACNAGSITLTSYPLISGDTYYISYAVLSISGGYVQLFAGTTGGIQRTVAGFYTETIIANGSVLTFFSNANCQIQAFNIQTQNVVNPAILNTIVYSPPSKRWSDRRTLTPDMGFSLGINTYPLQNGVIYGQINGGSNRNNFFGVQYQSSIKFVGNSQPEHVKKFKSLSLQANELMITTIGGVVTSLGMVSELIDTDWLKATLSGTTSVYTSEGVFSSFLHPDSETGDPLKGNWIEIELITADGALPLQLYTIGINDSLSHIGMR